MPSFENTVTLYVSPNGNNCYDGKTWLTPKKTVLSAYDALPSTRRRPLTV